MTENTLEGCKGKGARRRTNSAGTYAGSGDRSPARTAPGTARVPKHLRRGHRAATHEHHHELRPPCDRRGAGSALPADAAGHAGGTDRDFAQVEGENEIDAGVVQKALVVHSVDEMGLDEMDIMLLRAIIEKFDGGPVGLSNLAAVIGEEADTIEEVVEPYLIKEGFVKRTPKGRVAMPRAWERLGIDPLEGESGGEQLGLL